MQQPKHLEAIFPDALLCESIDARASFAARNGLLTWTDELQHARFALQVITPIGVVAEVDERST